MKFVNHPEDYIEPHGAGGYEYVYQYKDHLGNVRLSYSDSDNNGLVDSSEIIEENNYYPFGLTHRGYNNQFQGTYYPYGFGGKEENDELDLKWLDFEARNYDAALGRWMNLDPLAEDMRRHSPYNYAFNNPIFFIDPDGMAPVSVQDPPEYEGNVDAQTYTDTSSDQEYIWNEETSTWEEVVVEQLEEVTVNGEEDHFHAGPIGVGISIEIALPTFITGSNNSGFGISFGLVADADNNLDIYITDKEAKEGATFGIAPEVFYVHGTQGNINNDILQGEGFSTSGGAGPVGFEYSTSNDAERGQLSPYQQFTISGLGYGLDFGFVPSWQTNTKLINLWKGKK